MANGKGASTSRGFRSSVWRRVADIIQKMSDEDVSGAGVGNACGWDNAIFEREAADYISVTGTAILKEM